MKSVYMPKGKAGEYAAYAVNFFNGCSHECEYCYLKRGVLAKTLGGNKPELQKKYHVDSLKALENFEDDCQKYKDEFIKAGGLFFTFTSDPFLPETIELNLDAAFIAVGYGIPCTFLTKRADFIPRIAQMTSIWSKKTLALLSFGFTLTGHDEMEPHASTNAERIEAMKELHDAGFKTWASIEPIIDFQSSLNMIFECRDFCDLFKIGLRSGVKKNYYDQGAFARFVGAVTGATENKCKVYWKESMIEFAKTIDNPKGFEKLMAVGEQFVGPDYNLFNP